MWFVCSNRVCGRHEGGSWKRGCIKDEPSLVVEEDRDLESSRHKDMNIVEIEINHGIVQNPMFDNLENFDFIVIICCECRLIRRLWLPTMLFPKIFFEKHHREQRRLRMSIGWDLILLYFKIWGRVFSKKRGMIRESYLSRFNIIYVLVFMNNLNIWYIFIY